MHARIAGGLATFALVALCPVPCMASGSAHDAEAQACIAAHSGAESLDCLQAIADLPQRHRHANPERQAAGAVIEAEKVQAPAAVGKRRLERGLQVGAQMDIGVQLEAAGKVLGIYLHRAARGHARMDTQGIEGEHGMRLCIGAQNRVEQRIVEHEGSAGRSRGRLRCDPP